MNSPPINSLLNFWMFYPEPCHNTECLIIPQEILAVGIGNFTGIRRGTLTCTLPSVMTMTILQQCHTQIKVLVQKSLWYQTSLQLMDVGVGFLSLQPWQQRISERTCTTNHTLRQQQHQPDMHQCRLFPVENAKGNTQTESSSGIKVYLLITEWISQTHGAIFGVFCAGQGVGLDDPDGFPLTHYVLWVCDSMTGELRSPISPAAPQGTTRQLREWGEPAGTPPSPSPTQPSRPEAVGQARIKAVLWHSMLFVTTPAKRHKWILSRITICVLVSHNTPDS